MPTLQSFQTRRLSWIRSLVLLALLTPDSTWSITGSGATVHSPRLDSLLQPWISGAHVSPALVEADGDYDSDWDMLCAAGDIPLAQCLYRLLETQLAQKALQLAIPSSTTQRRKRKDVVQFCPPDMEKVECFERYFWFLIRSHAGQRKRGHATPARAFQSSRAMASRDARAQTDDLPELCPDDSKLECFSYLLRLWLQSKYGAARRQHQQVQQTKASGDRKHAESRSEEFVDNGAQTEAARDTDDRTDDDNGDDDDDDDGDDDDKFSQNWLQHQQGLWRGKRSMGICPSNMDTLTCFDQYLAMYLKVYTNRRLVGRKHISSMAGDTHLPTSKSSSAPSKSRTKKDHPGRLACNEDDPLCYWSQFFDS